jgi:hypothetical protein
MVPLQQPLLAMDTGQTEGTGNVALGLLEFIPLVAGFHEFWNISVID